MTLRRRQFLHTVAAGTAGLTLAGNPETILAQTVPTSSSATVAVPELINGSVQINSSVTLPAANASGIEHIVVVTMENRSFDHLLGWLPGADGRQAGLTYQDAAGVAHPAYNLAPDFEGCGHNDPDHSYSGSRTAYDGGKMDGFLRAGKNDIFSIGYYTEPSVPFYAALARNYLVCNRYFAGILGPTFANRMFIWAAQTDRLGDDVTLSSLPTIFDRLAAAGVSHKYYFNNLPYLAFWGLKYFGSTALFGSFLADAAAGSLPAVSFVDPTYTILDDGTGNDDHPHADIRNGEAFLSKIYRALTANPAAWAKTVLIINFDEWGGFFEHVAPPRVVAANQLDTDQVNGQVLLGLRVPTVIVSPFTRNTTGNPLVTSTVFDHTSVLKLIEWRYGLAPLTPRDASSQIGNPATSLNFVSPNPSLPNIPFASSVFATPCFGGGIFSPDAAGSLARTTQAPSTVWADFAETPYPRQWLQTMNSPR